MNASDNLKVFITGASSGIGLALARAYAHRGARLGLVARRGEALSALAREFPHLDIAVFEADVRDDTALAGAAAQFVARFGCPDVVIANAGISVGALTGEGELASFRAVMDTNFLGMLNTFEPFIGPLARAGSGTLVGIASVAGVRGLPGAGAYSASKAAATRYLEALRIELRRSGVAVVTIAPGYIRTPMTHGNSYPMPFLMDVDPFAEKCLAAIARRSAFVVLPWPMRVVGMLLHVMPRWLYDRLMQYAPRKARAVR